MLAQLSSLPYALGITATLVRVKLREEHLLCRLNLHHWVAVTTANSVAWGLWPEKKG